jgi:prephenate dehydrogenase
LESIGTTVVRMDADLHDRTMAQTHALAFYVAKGLLDIGVPTDSPAAPPSFQAMARTIEAVRGDAGHLLLSLHRENPYSAEYRMRLLQTLSRLDAALESGAGSAAEPSYLTIEPAGNVPELSRTRDRIDEIDREIVSLLTRRAELSRRALSAKRVAGRAILDEDRETSLLAERGEWAAENGLDPDATELVFRAILQMSRRIQEDA